MIHFIPLILFSISLNAFAQLSLKKAMLNLGDIMLNMDFLIRMISSFYLWLGISFYIFSLITWLVVLSKIEVSVAYPFLSFGFIISIVASYFLFGESLNINKIIGICLICIGLIFISKSSIN